MLFIGNEKVQIESAPGQRKRAREQREGGAQEMREKRRKRR